MTPEDQYPSTADCAMLFKDGDDLVDLCLENSRGRVEREHSRSAYVGMGGNCAIGAVWAEDGVMDVIGLGGSAKVIKHHGDTYHAWEEALSQEAMCAIKLLNRAALELHPEAEDVEGWSGPLEWVNQEWAPDVPDRKNPDPDAYAYEHGSDALRAVVKERILQIYDRARELRQEELARVSA